LAVPADLDRLVELERAHASDRFSRSQLHYLLTRANAVILVAEAVEHEVLGNVIVLYRHAGRSGHLYSLTVASEHHGRGIGRLLLLHAEELTRELGRDRIVLEVRSDNERAIRLYRAAGYEQVGIKPAYYSDGRDALKMEKDLNAPG
jgi:ribosomal-protein-alanine N-acetyltransferase